MVVFDTPLLIWGIRGDANARDVGMISRVRNLIEELQKNNEVLGIPAPAFAELLQGCDIQKRSSLKSDIERFFPILPLDARAAEIAAGMEWKRVFQSLNDNRGRDRSLQDPTRQEIKVDSLIAAVAIAHRATRFYSADRDYLVYDSFFAEHEVQLCRPPQHQLELDLFDEKTDQSGLVTIRQRRIIR